MIAGIWTRLCSLIRAWEIARRGMSLESRGLATGLWFLAAIASPLVARSEDVAAPIPDHASLSVRYWGGGYWGAGAMSYVEPTYVGCSTCWNGQADDWGYGITADGGYIAAATLENGTGPRYILGGVIGATLAGFTWEEPPWPWGGQLGAGIKPSVGLVFGVLGNATNAPRIGFLLDIRYEELLPSPVLEPFAPPWPFRALSARLILARISTAGWTVSPCFTAGASWGNGQYGIVNGAEVHYWYTNWTFGAGVEWMPPMRW